MKVQEAVKERHAEEETDELAGIWADRQYLLRGYRKMLH
jgi:hypothetical protein